VRRGLLMLGLLSVLVAGTSLALANPGFETKLTIGVEEDGNRFIWSGQAKSDEDGCENGRLVRLFNQSASGQLNSDTTNGDGEWRIVQRFDTLDGAYYAKVKRKVTPGFVCKADRSRMAEIPAG
jgi:hypothetical protein